MREIRDRLYYNITESIKPAVVKAKNKGRSWQYGYNEKYDIVVISKTGRIGEIYEVEGLKIALPLCEGEVSGSDLKKDDQYWKREELPKPLAKIDTFQKWKKKTLVFRKSWIDYIDEEFERRKLGFFYMNNGVETYLTGSHYQYLQWSNIDVGFPEFRESNRIFFIFWEACKADSRCYGMCYVKNRRSGFSFMAAAETVNLGTLAKERDLGILSKTREDARDLFINKVVPISSKYPFFFKPIQAGMDKPKTILEYSVPATKISKKSLMNDFDDDDEELEGLNTSINYMATKSNSYDGKKLLLLVHDESGKWLPPENILQNLRVTRTCLRLGRKIVGKCMMGSTSNSLREGGGNFKKLYLQSDITKRNANGQTASGLYSMFIPMEFNFEGFIDKFGHSVLRTPKEPVMGNDGELIKVGSIDYWQAEVDGLKDDSDGLNEYYRQYPRTESHAFRDESKESLFDLTKIYSQIDFNDSLITQRHITRGSFSWRDGVKDSKVIFSPNPNGRFLVSWVPRPEDQNKFIVKNGTKWPGNELAGAFGCDSYDISGTVGGGGSNGALHGLTNFSMDENPNNQFFLEYIARPQTAEIFFEDVLMAIVFYGMPILVENNKPRLLYHLKNRGYRGYSMNRPDKPRNKLSQTERELGGIPNSSEDIKQAHAAAIESHIEKYIGYDTTGSYRPADEIGIMPFSRTLEDWAKFDISNRTKHDASISSGLAIMACQKHLYMAKKLESKISVNFATYNNKGSKSEMM